MMKSLCNIEMRKLEHVILRGDFAINFEMKKIQYLMMNEIVLDDIVCCCRVSENIKNTLET